MQRRTPESVQNKQLILAGDAQPGCRYLSRTGRQVIIKEKEKGRILVEAVSTGNIIPLPVEYLLQPIL